jgi:isocitrate dehydrogenase (NAD+)
MAHRVTLIPGDGTGPELTEAARRVLDATGVAIAWEVREAGIEAPGGEIDPLPAATLDAIRNTGVALKGPLASPIGSSFHSPSGAIRARLGLYAQVRPCKTFAGARSRFDNVDLVVIRECTEDLYVGIEFEQGTANARALRDWVAAHGQPLPHPDAGMAIKPISATATRRIFEFAFAYARKHGRRKITAVHKANVQKYTDGLWLYTARTVASENPDIEFEDRIVDNLCMQLVQRPEEYDVLVLPNLYGDIVSDIAAGLVGGLGLAPGANYGDGVAVFEPTHGSAPKYAGANRANPIAQILSGCLLLRHLGEHAAADRVEQAVADLIREGTTVTFDMKVHRDDPSAATTSDVADALIATLQR